MSELLRGQFKVTVQSAIICATASTVIGIILGREHVQIQRAFIGGFGAGVIASLLSLTLTWLGGRFRLLTGEIFWYLSFLWLLIAIVLVITFSPT
jgi:hypothetical protein